MRVKIENVCKSYDGKIVFENVSGTINQGDKIGLIGENGVGKTTLLRIIAGEEECDSGSVFITPTGMKTGFLIQHMFFSGDECMEKMTEDMDVGKQLNFSQQGMALKRMLSNCEALKENCKIESLSGGEKTKLALLKVFASKTDLLILDEPTNHLDMETIEALEGFIASCNETMVIVSHDREFLDKTASRIFELKRDGMKEYQGNYSQYQKQRMNELKNQQKEYDKQQAETKALKKMINERKAWYEKAHRDAGQSDVLRRKAKKHVNVMRAKEKQLERLESKRVLRPKEDVAASFEIINERFKGDKCSRNLIHAEGLCKHFGERVLFENASFDVSRGDKIAVVGGNGSGKTTLLNILEGQDGAYKGKLCTSSSCSMGYFSQEFKQLHCENTMLEELKSVGTDEETARLILGCLLFKGEDAYKKIGSLSMGERGRVAFAKLMCQDFNTLILDEPTNYMDIMSRQKVEHVLKAYAGTVILVSHDRSFIRNVATRVFHIENKSIKVHDGGYEYFNEKRLSAEKSTKIKDSSNMKDEISKMECEIACLSGRLDDTRLEQEEKDEIVQKFIDAVKKVNEYKKAMTRLHCR